MEIKKRAISLEFLFILQKTNKLRGNSQGSRGSEQQFQVSAYGKLNCKHAGPVGGKSFLSRSGKKDWSGKPGPGAQRR
jgi:hypothetical protein